MKLNVYVVKNTFLGCSGQPIFDDHEPDVFSKQVERSLLTGPEEKVFKHQNSIWYHIGSYDDESLKFSPVAEPVRLLDCGQVLDDRKVRLSIIAKAQKMEKN